MSFKTPIQRFFDPIFFAGIFSLTGFLVAGIILLLIALRLVIPTIIGFGVWWILSWFGSFYAIEFGVGAAVLVFVAGLITANVSSKRK